MLPRPGKGGTKKRQMKKRQIERIVRDEMSRGVDSYQQVAIRVLKKNPDINRSLRTIRRMASFIHRGKSNDKEEYGNIRKLPAVLVFDVETSPMEVFVWGLYKQRINPDNVIQDWNLISWAAKWLFDPEIMSDALTPREAVRSDDKRISTSLWKLFEAADVVIAHNAQKFDVRKANARFVLNGLKPTSPYQIIDTLMQSRKIFGFSSNKLNYLGQILINKEKLETDFGLWKRCVNGDQEALKYMETYNREDVALLEEVYMQLRPWIKSHPNLRLYGDTDERICHVCLSGNLSECSSEYTTIAGRFQSFRCDDCGAISRVRKSNLTKKEKENMVVPTAR
jgi:RNase P subunit RPR2